MSTITVTNPQEIRKDNRQAHNREREQNPARKEAVRIWCTGKLCTCGCGQPANCAHHPTDDLYQDEWADLSQCEPYQSWCHMMHHRGFERCPECRGWMRKGREKCAKCSGWRKRNQPSGRIRHPCRKNVGRQKCTELIVCSYSPKKASACDHFGERVTA